MHVRVCVCVHTGRLWEHLANEIATCHHHELLRRVMMGDLVSHRALRYGRCAVTQSVWVNEMGEEVEPDSPRAPLAKKVAVELEKENVDR